MEEVGFESVIAIAVGTVVIPVLVIAGSLYAAVVSMSRPGTRLRPVSPDQQPRYYSIVGAHHAEITEQGFQWVGGYLFSATSTLFVAAWRHHRLPTYFCIYCHGSREYFDFVTIYSDESGLTTSSTKDAHTLPHRPHSFVESFLGASPRALWIRHQKSMEFLKSRFRMTPAPRDVSFEDEIVTSIRGQMAYVRAIPLWPIRGVYWYLVGRSRQTGRSVEQQNSE